MMLMIRGVNLSAALGELTLSKGREDAAATLRAVLYFAPGDSYAIEPSVAVGDGVQLVDSGGSVRFTGGVFTLSRTAEELRLTAFDRGVYLSRNQLSGLFVGSGGDIVRQVAGKLGLAVGKVEATPLRQTILASAGRSAFSILRQAAGAGREIGMADGVVSVRRGDGVARRLAAEEILTVQSCCDISAMVNRCLVRTRKGAVAAQAELTAELGRYGQFQTVQTLQSGADASTQARDGLQGRSMTAAVTVRGNLSLHCGGRVELFRREWGLWGQYTVTEVAHRWYGGGYTTELVVEQSEGEGARG